MTDRESLVLCSYYLDNPALRRFHAIIRPEQFQEPGTSMLFTVLQKYHQEYGRMPTHQEAEMEVRDYRGPKQHDADSALELLGRYAAERGAAATEPRSLKNPKRTTKTTTRLPASNYYVTSAAFTTCVNCSRSGLWPGWRSARRNMCGTSSTARNNVSAPGYRRLTS